MADVITTLHPEGAPEDDLYPNVKDENIPSNIQRKGVELWRNADPTASMTSGTVIYPNENLTNFERVIIGTRFTTGSTLGSVRYDEFELSFAENSVVSISWVDSGGSRYQRNFVIRPASISVVGGAINGNDNDAVCIPVAIYGVDKED